MKTVKLATFVALISMLALSGFAHGGKPHLMGTVSSVDATHITVKDTSGKVVTVNLTPKTEYRLGDGKGQATDVQPGRRVVVHLAADGSAAEVHVSTK
ncbi:MAG TPA: hypothetical protein VHL58_14740 [Thermoanaerobaculia bacterium]|nr:hypothetical protein [Thermoanaerobaculia bacterium]